MQIPSIGLFYSARIALGFARKICLVRSSTSVVFSWLCGSVSAIILIHSAHKVIYFLIVTENGPYHTSASASHDLKLYDLVELKADYTPRPKEDRVGVVVGVGDTSMTTENKFLSLAEDDKFSRQGRPSYIFPTKYDRLDPDAAENCDFEEVVDGLKADAVVAEKKSEKKALKAA